MPTATFNATGGWQVFTVPKGVKSITVSISGAGSGTAKGGRVTGKLAVKDAQRLYLVVGEAGKPHSGRSGGDSTFGGGARGGTGYNDDGGASGGGYSAIRDGSTAGKILGVAGGAGGRSGDGGEGGDGGTTTGQSGSRGNAGSGATGAATGGTQSQGGSGGTSSSGSRFYGGDPSNTPLTRAGAGGATGGLDGPGGGGGGGGYHPGGGGQGGSTGYAPGGGGGGGSNYVGSLTGVSSSRGVRTGSGQIVITWVTPAPAVQPGNTPSNLVPAKGTRTRSTGKLTVKANVSDPGKRAVRAVFIFDDGAGNRLTRYSPYVKQGKSDSSKVASYTAQALRPNRHYTLTVYAENDKGLRSRGYARTDFYTNYDPTYPDLIAPINGYQSNGLSAIIFTWRHNDPDGGNQRQAQIQFINQANNKAETYNSPGPQRTFTKDGATFEDNTFYLWRVRTQDAQGQWSPWSLTNRFFITGVSVPPRNLSPKNDEAVDTGTTQEFSWKFFDPSPSDVQVKADIRYKTETATDWQVLFGNIVTPGATAKWTLPGKTFQAGHRYLWQVRTYDSGSGGNTPSGWSNEQSFIAIATPGYNALKEPITSDAYQGELGYGKNKVLITTRGGQHFVGEFKDPLFVEWNRVRDDISTCKVEIKLDNDYAKQLARRVRSWKNEIKILRTTDEDDRRSYVWEGPINYVNYNPTTGVLTLRASDVMVWVYRRAMRQGYSDAYPATTTVVQRAARIIINALAIDDPNILPWLTQFNYSNDAQTSRVRPDVASTAWEEVDDMAQKSGLDYTTVGRRIILNDTHRPIGRLPAMSDGDFLAPVEITEYGMNAADRFWTTNGAGVSGLAVRSDSVYGILEMVQSAYGDQAAAADNTLTPAARAKLQATFAQQSERNIAHRYPAPIHVRVPDNTGIAPKSPVSIEHLIPGVWLPLVSDNDVIPVRQWQKLSTVKVTQSPEQGEVVAVTMQPAPNQGEDPDSAEAAENMDGV